MGIEHHLYVSAHRKMPKNRDHINLSILWKMKAQKGLFHNFTYFELLKVAKQCLNKNSRDKVRVLSKIKIR